MAENLFDLTGKVALVTGANSGLGLAMAQGLARAGADLVIWGRREDRNAEAAQRLRALADASQPARSTSPANRRWSKASPPQWPNSAGWTA